MAAADRELVSIRVRARRQPLEQRIIRAVASSTAIETREPVSEIEARLRSSQRLLVNRRPVTLA
ncbi:MAG: hypothetical protein NTV57_19985 [Cyanobacteria bacterium]|jgi:hypothetical protein|nr:hypothetical protein [Cyanobacteriota bacterium]